MKNHSYISMQQDTPDQGQLQVTVWDGVNNRPVENARVRFHTRVCRTISSKKYVRIPPEKRLFWIWRLRLWNTA